MWIGYEPTDRHLSGTGWSSETWLQITPTQLSGTHLDIHRQVPVHWDRTSVLSKFPG